MNLPANFPVDDVVHAIQMRICFIETGTVTYRATDAAQINDAMGADRLRHGIKIKALQPEQRDLIARLEKAASDLQGSASSNRS